MATYTIKSSGRDIERYPLSTDFSIELLEDNGTFPQSLLDAQSLSAPCDYGTVASFTAFSFDVISAKAIHVPNLFQGKSVRLYATGTTTPGVQTVITASHTNGTFTNVDVGASILSLGPATYSISEQPPYEHSGTLGAISAILGNQIQLAGATAAKITRSSGFQWLLHAFHVSNGTADATRVYGITAISANGKTLTLDRVFDNSGSLSLVGFGLEIWAVKDKRSARNRAMASMHSNHSKINQQSSEPCKLKLEYISISPHAVFTNTALGGSPIGNLDVLLTEVRINDQPTNNICSGLINVSDIYGSRSTNMASHVSHICHRQSTVASTTPWMLLKENTDAFTDQKTWKKVSVRLTLPSGEVVQIMAPAALRSGFVQSMTPTLADITWTWVLHR